MFWWDNYSYLSISSNLNDLKLTMKKKRIVKIKIIKKINKIKGTKEFPEYW